MLSRWVYAALCFVLLLTSAMISGCSGTASPGPGPTPTATPTPSPTATPTPTPGPSLQSVNHIIFMMQENRAFDSYFGKINDLRAAQGLGRDADTLDTLYSQPADDGSTITNFHLTTVCIYNLSQAWLESHGDVNRDQPADGNPVLINGFVHTAGGEAVSNNFPDTKGVRGMGFYDHNDMPSPYFFATQFATSDRWYTPAPLQTEAVRLYSMAATSQGFAHPPGSSTLRAKTIFQLLDAAGVSWKIYAVDKDPNTGKLITTFTAFDYASTRQDHIVPISEFKSDLDNGTLPQFAYIEPSYISGFDEHPGSTSNIQAGAAFIRDKIITLLMSSTSWKDSIFIETFDEAGGTFDHVGPMINGQQIQELTVNAGVQSVALGRYPGDAVIQNVPSPDLIPPQDLKPADPPGDFTRTGFRVPVMVISPFAKAHYVSHVPMDWTAVLKLVETRFNLPHLTNRDAAQPDMAAEFFDFVNAPNKNVTSLDVPKQPVPNNNCDATKASAASGSPFTPPN